MKLFKIHTEENGKDVNFGIHGVYSEEDNPNALASEQRK